MALRLHSIHIEHPLTTALGVLYSRTMLNKNFRFTKRQLGLLCVVIGVIGFAGIMGIDILDAGREGGIGPAQRIALGLTIALTLLGLTLIPLGDDPA